MAKKGSLSLGDVHNSGRNPRRWPLSYFFSALLIIVLLPQVFYKAKQQAQAVKRTKSIFGDNLQPTPWHWHLNELGPQSRSWERSWELLKCSYPGWAKPGHIVNTTESSQQCPAYFQWIKKDLSPWERTGITATNIEMAKENAAFKVIILKGRLYVDMYYSCVQTRAPFTIWGMLMLLEKYEGKIPDVEILFDCMDRPQIRKPNHRTDTSWSPAPLFRYCSNKWHYDIPWPDWSFWGWAETEIEPWQQEIEKIMKGSRKKAWRFKNPKAFWRGNPDVASPLRLELLQCNNATRFPKSEIVRQVWGPKSSDEKWNSKLENQCNHRYKIYAEGFAWSVSFKYIMACGSPTLVIAPKYHDFFMRGLEPYVHYIPVRPADICAHHLCTALDWGVRFGERDELKVWTLKKLSRSLSNKYGELDVNIVGMTCDGQAIRIGEAGFNFVNEQVSMARVYDYMYHMLRSYAALQRFKPAIPRTAREVTQSFVLCASKPHERRLLEESKRKVPWTTPPCSLNFKTGGEAGPKNFLWEDDAHVDDGWSSRNCAAARVEPWKPNPRNGQTHDPPKPTNGSIGDHVEAVTATTTGKEDTGGNKKKQPTEDHNTNDQKESREKKTPKPDENPHAKNEHPVTRNSPKGARPEKADHHQDSGKEAAVVVPKEKENRDGKLVIDSNPKTERGPEKPKDGKSEVKINPKEEPAAQRDREHSDGMQLSSDHNLKQENDRVTPKDRTESHNTEPLTTSNSQDENLHKSSKSQSRRKGAKS